MTELLKALYDLEQIELQMAGMYEGFAEIFQNDPDAADLFGHLWLEEISHQNILQYESRIVRSNPKAFRDIDFNLGTLDRTLQTLRGFRQANPMPTLEEAIRTALLFEAGTAELYSITIFMDAARDFAQFVTNLHAANWNHFDKLQRFAAQRRIAVPFGIINPKLSMRSILSPSPLERKSPAADDTGDRRRL